MGVYEAFGIACRLKREEGGQVPPALKCFVKLNIEKEIIVVIVSSGIVIGHGIILCNRQY